MDEDILIPIAFFAAVVWITKIISDNRIRRKALENPVSEDTARAVLAHFQSTPTALSALKWGLVIAAVGAVFLVIELFSVDADQPLAYGLLFLGAGAGLITYYFIASDEEKEKKSPSLSKEEYESFEDLP